MNLNLTMENLMLPYTTGQQIPEVTDVRCVVTFESIYPDDVTIQSTAKEMAFLTNLESILQEKFPNADVYACLDGEQYIVFPSEISGIDNPDTYHWVLEEMDMIAQELAANYFSEVEEPENVLN